MAVEDVWSPVAAALVRGAHHELNNRVASLSAVEQVIASGAEMTSAIRDALVSEIGKMRHAIGLLGRVPDGRPAPAAAFRPRDVVASVLEIARLHHDLRDLDVELACGDDVPPVRADASAVARALLVMIAAAARTAARAGARPPELGCATDGEHVRITLAPLETTEAERLAIAAWLRPSGGESGPAGRLAYSISLPALTAAG